MLDARGGYERGIEMLSLQTNTTTEAPRVTKY